MSPVETALQAQQIQFSTIARSSPESPRNDTANVVELPDGRLVAVWHRYSAGPEGGSDFGCADIALARSSDGGQTWLDERIIIERAPEDINVQAPALCLLSGGELILGVMRAHGKGSSSLCLYQSPDLGETWNPAGSIWERSQGQWLQGGAASIVQLAGGRLIFPFHGGEGTQWAQHNTAGFWISDDRGLTWRKSPAVIDLPMRGAMEASVAELGDGRLLVSLRTQLGTVFLCESLDGGETWSLPWSAGLTAPESCTCLRRIPGSDTLLLMWNGCEFYEPAHHHYGQRTPLSLAVSSDAGRSWRRIGDLEHEPDTGFTNLNATFTEKNGAILTYWAVSPAFGRGAGIRSDLVAALIPQEFWASL